MDPRMAELIVAARQRELRDEAAAERLAAEARRARQPVGRPYAGGTVVVAHGGAPVWRLFGR